ncbi:MAG: lipoyl(octanoyl) transferase LipB [Candidatus Marinimicrobia bacterium]|nr:lipoyl(octanoyl) transferase LipB [Candidatus Neomarinimicrobiota bacterium]
MSKILEVLDLGYRNYGEIWELQKRLHFLRVKGVIPDTLILVEHNHVYTFGKNATRENLLVSDEYLKQRGIEVYHVDRGGDVTYHGPGQLVGYPIFNLKEHKESVSWFVNKIEQVLIDTLKEIGIEADRIKGLTGVWVRDNKIAAIGMRVSKLVTMHGFALNVANELSYYSGIIPCGIRDKGIIRIIDLKPEVSLSMVKDILINKFLYNFNFESYKVREEYTEDIERDEN